MRRCLFGFNGLFLALSAPLFAEVAPSGRPDGSSPGITQNLHEQGLDSQAEKARGEGVDDSAARINTSGVDIKGKKTSRENRANSKASVFYEPLNLGIVLPTKSGWAATWVVDDDWAIEGEYLSGSLGIGVSGIDLVDVSERLVLGRVRWTFGNSLNTSMGFGNRSYRFSLGSDTLAKITDYNVAALPNLKVQNEFLSIGIGNRWQWSNGLTLGVDWLEFIMTVGRGSIDDRVTTYLKDEKDRENSRQALNYLRYGPTFNALKFQLGYSF